ncbi:exodeoxyribonuclease V alpha subunit [Microbacterium sp. W4I4]|uniref:AAA family ATPase n=1 Tax=Microbacterium sp. W4I4 TaxID=3042295 RepID=UPI002783F3EB|nr:AAA family ATPase [Microbacterium sp. W4I4]MDQ0615310.1 exodeoxyribonuclease V alpha subunit [Microbacterium sp. W4I4]
MAYAFRGSCDSHLRAAGIEALGAYSQVGAATVTRFSIESGRIIADELDAEQLTKWVDGRDPETGELRGRELASPASDLILDSTINASKSFSIAALLHPELASAFEALQDRLRDRIIATWQRELNARRGAGGRIRERLSHLEVVELQHRRSRALDPHIHRHLWLNVRVRGVDGKWSNVDSRVAMRVQNLVNAEGELAARTDPEWVAALAAHGYTLDADGEITQLAHLVRAVSRRSNQIEANRAVLLEQWKSEQPGQVPSPDVVQMIDRRAWATGRPGKPREVDEDEWSDLTKQELLHLDPNVLAPCPPIVGPRRAESLLDHDLLARRAVADADDRSRASNGRFSVLDVRAGAARAVASAGLVADRDELQYLIDDITARALAHTRDLIPDDLEKPQHVKVLVTHAFAQLKSDLSTRLSILSNDQPPAPRLASGDAARIVTAGGLDTSQQAAAGAVADVDRLVTVTGPAGTGKTTMLRVARAALEVQGRRLLIVAPTRKAAAVASREIGASGTSVHALLADHGWKWGTDDAGADLWWRLRPGQTDPATGVIYRGPRRYPLDARARIVVDEAGMLDLNAADALAQLAIETGAGIALVGDPLQASPVGHAGAMALAQRRAGKDVVLSGMHRFADPDYAALTLRLRSPDTLFDAIETATALQQQHHVKRVDDLESARAALVHGYFQHHEHGRTVAIVTATNEEASSINEAIQQERVSRAQLSTHRIAVGADEQRILEGDVVQTRRNDRDAGVENRAIWQVVHIGPAALELQRIDDAADTRVVSREYAADYVHLAYATTVHGIQGETTDTSLVGPDVDASGLYVGLTRGRRHNEVVVIARTDAEAREELAGEMMRGLPEPDIADAISAARRDLHRSARDEHPEGAAEFGRWVHAARTALLQADAEDAGAEAREHGRAATERPRERASLDSETRARLQERLARAEAIEARDLVRYVNDDREQRLHPELVAAAPASTQGGIQ